MKKPTVIISPLDWGLGHTTRLKTIIKQLIELHFDVIFAGNENQIEIIEKEFPLLKFTLIDGYNIKYSRLIPFYIMIALQLPKIFIAIRREKKILKKIVQEYNADIVISDNRYGLYHPQTYNIFISHQLSIKTGKGVWMDKIIKKINHGILTEFDEIWVPDFADAKSNLSGELSVLNNKTLENKTFPINPLSNISNNETYYNSDSFILILLSGPEPLRTQLEEQLCKHIQNIDKHFILVRGSKKERLLRYPDNIIEIVDLADAITLSKLITSSEFVICRSGYSSIMDLVKCRKKGLLIPTPGQAEQEYLAHYLSNKGQFKFIEQKNLFDFSTIINQMKEVSIVFPTYENELLKERIEKIRVRFQ